MTVSAIEKRVTALEQKVAQLQDQLLSKAGGTKDWRRTIGAFTDDDGVKELLRDAMRLRELDRKKSHAGKARKRKPGK